MSVESTRALRWRELRFASGSDASADAARMAKRQNARSLLHFHHRTVTARVGYGAAVRILIMQVHQHRIAVLFAELEVTLVVEFGERQRVRMLRFQVIEMVVRLVGGVAALLAHVHLRTTLLVRVVVLNVVHLQRVRLQTTALGERFVTRIAFVWTNACKKEKRSGMVRERAFGRLTKTSVNRRAHTFSYIQIEKQEQQANFILSKRAKAGENRIFLV